MEFNLKTIAEDNYWIDEYYTGVKRLLIRKLFDPREPYITPAYFCIFVQYFCNFICNFN